MAEMLMHCITLKVATRDDKQSGHEKCDVRIVTGPGYYFKETPKMFILDVHPTNIIHANRIKKSESYMIPRPRYNSNPGPLYGVYEIYAKSDELDKAIELIRKHAISDYKLMVERAERMVIHLQTYGAGDAKL